MTGSLGRLKKRLKVNGKSANILQMNNALKETLNEVKIKSLKTE